MPVNVHPSTDIDEINRIINHPEVRPYVASASDGVINIEAQVKNPDNLFLMGEFGGQMFTRFMPGVCEVHTFVLPDGRGAWAQGLCWATMEYLFTKTDTYEILTRIPQTHPAARGLAVSVGMTKEFYREDGVLINDEVVPVDIYRITIQDWVKRAPDLEERGRHFHDWLNAKAAKAGYTQSHEDDPEHNRVVGAALGMLYGGQPIKGTLTYNRWAFIVRHATISLVSVDPITVDMDIGQIKLVAGKLEFVANGGSRCGAKDSQVTN